MQYDHGIRDVMFILPIHKSSRLSISRLIFWHIPITYASIALFFILQIEHRICKERRTFLPGCLGRKEHPPCIGQYAMGSQIFVYLAFNHMPTKDILRGVPAAAVVCTFTTKDYTYPHSANEFDRGCGNSLSVALDTAEGMCWK